MHSGFARDIIERELRKERYPATLRKKDMIMILAVLLAACALLILSRQPLNGRATGRVNIYVDGALYATGLIGADTPIVVEQEDALNVIAFTEHGFYMQSSNCKNQQCVHQGEVTLDNYRSRALGTRIICLPNRVTAELVMENEQGELPDV